MQQTGPERVQEQIRLSEKSDPFETVQMTEV